MSDLEPTGLRASDRERDDVAGRLATALSLGYLSQDEFDERTSAALRAVTVEQLSVLETDLPTRQLQQADPEQQRRDQLAARRGVIAHVSAYAVSVVVMLGIWLATAIAYGPHYFWPIWPILGWGLGVVGHVLPSRHGHRSGPGFCGRPAISRS